LCGTANNVQNLRVKGRIQGEIRKGYCKMLVSPADFMQYKFVKGAYVKIRLFLK